MGTQEIRLFPKKQFLEDSLGPNTSKKADAWEPQDEKCERVLTHTDDTTVQV